MNTFSGKVELDSAGHFTGGLELQQGGGCRGRTQEFSGTYFTSQDLDVEGWLLVEIRYNETAESLRLARDPPKSWAQGGRTTCTIDGQGETVLFDTTPGERRIICLINLNESKYFVFSSIEDALAAVTETVEKVEQLDAQPPPKLIQAVAGFRL